jgi:hypothetical protein
MTNPKPLFTAIAIVFAVVLSSCSFTLIRYDADCPKEKQEVKQARCAQ